ncbi:Ni/Co efflux regulator RcnB [Erwinia persicina]|mgnify:CR=1 FL=1|jgi:Ni/Co efflux regulator RcnB|uniref:RcnB family protein n=1 Tax=Erwinia TaxID=551 RepID=UPI0020A03976|nr:MULTISPECIES: RcnB family protein [Erwinia]MCP1438815.1 Ni/Co efflux regulator RcnB [Erwinia persicina]MDN4626830.1 RcnB family protein [Erwinia sp. PsM31]
MSKSTSILFSAFLLAATPLVSTAFAEDVQTQQDPAAAAPATDAPAANTPATDAPATDAPATDAPATDAPSAAPIAPEAQTPSQAQTPSGETAAPQRDPAHPYEIQYFFADFQRFTIGSVVPDRYRTKKYEIVDWKTRNLPAPEQGTSWTYMGGNYVQISKEDGRILKVESGDIFYKQ